MGLEQSVALLQFTHPEFLTRNGYVLRRTKCECIAYRGDGTGGKKEDYLIRSNLIYLGNWIGKHRFPFEPIRATDM
jgi:hypothetical protein